MPPQRTLLNNYQADVWPPMTPPSYVYGSRGHLMYPVSPRPSSIKIGHTQTTRAVSAEAS